MDITASLYRTACMLNCPHGGRGRPQVRSRPNEFDNGVGSSWNVGAEWLCVCVCVQARLIRIGKIRQDLAA